MRYHFTAQAQLALNNAKMIAKECENSYIGTEHLLLGILRIEESKLESCLKDLNINYEMIFNEVMTLFGFSKEHDSKMEYTCTMDEILQQCLIEAYQNSKKLVDLNCLTLCLLEADNNVANELLRRFDVDIEELKMKFSEDNLEIVNNFKELKNLNLAQKKNPTKIVRREEELESIIDILCRKSKANPLLIGEAGVGKSAIVEELARRIVSNEAPEELKECIIYELDLNSLVAGTKYRGEFEEKIEKLLSSVLKYPNIILFIDEVHMMVNAGKAEGSIDVAGVLKPYLARGNFRCIGATTIDEYNNGIEKDRALKRRFQVIKVKEPLLSDVKIMLECKKEEYEKHHQVRFPSNLIDDCLEMSIKYLPGLMFPDKAIDVMDLSCVKAKKAGMESVEFSCIEHTIKSISEIPYSFSEKIKEQERELKKVFDEINVQRIMNRFNTLDKHKLKNKPFDVWYLSGENSSTKRKVAEMLAKIFLNHEKELTLFDGALINMNNMVYLHQKCKKNPFQIIYIENYDKMSTTMMDLFQTIFHQGQLQCQDFNLNLTYSFFLIDKYEKKSKALGFILSDKKEINDQFCLDLSSSFTSKVH